MQPSNQPDHDKLIRFETQYEDFSADMIAKIESFKNEWVKLFNGQQEKITKLSEDEQAIDKYISQYPLKELVTKLEDVITWQNNFKLLGKFSHVVAFFLGVVVAITIVLLTGGKINILTLFKF